MNATNKGKRNFSSLLENAIERQLLDSLDKIARLQN
jgi:hypothetical protein